MFDFSIVTSWIHGLLTSLMPLGLAVFLECVIVGVCLLLMYTVIAILMIFMERKVCAAFQCRLGPMRVGPWGTVQVICDVFKMLTKEIITIRRSDRFLYNLAPYIVILASVLAFACLPVNKGLEVLDFNVGVFFMMAASSIGVVGILLAGWSSNNKYSLIGAMRSGAQMISYELSIGLSILTIIVLTDTMQFSEIVARQADGWFLFKGHIPALIAFVIYLIAGNAEVNRGPFDLPEAESELTAGYHTEYSGMHFGLFYVAEFVNLFIVAGVAATIFLGGWMPLHIAGWEGFNAVMDCIPGFVWFFAKAFFVVWLLMWIKWTFPRLRIDQILIDLAWVLDALGDDLLRDLVEGHALGLIVRQIQQLLQVPGDGLALAVRVGGKINKACVLGSLFQLVAQLTLASDVDIFRCKIVFDVHTQTAFGQITHMTHRSHDLIALAQIFLDGLCLCRRLHDYQFCHDSLLLYYKLPA